jgi:hypothetical protein
MYNQQKNDLPNLSLIYPTHSITSDSYLCNPIAKSHIVCSENILNVEVLYQCIMREE